MILKRIQIAIVLSCIFIISASAQNMVWRPDSTSTFEVGTQVNAYVNLPLSGGKANQLEGGIRVPFLMKWSGKIPTNQTYDYPIITLDLLPTFIKAAGVSMDTIKNMDGVNLFPYITEGKTGRPHQKLFWKKECRALVHDRDWKLIRFPDRPAELFHIVKDESEHYNLAYKYPDKVKQLYKDIFEWELSLERPRWILQRSFEKQDIERMDDNKKLY